MSFQTGLSGLNAASRNLDVIGHNIANVNTIGMKASRSEFSALVSSALGSATAGGSGIGVELAAVAQQFTQGNISTTGNNLDVAINGSGFFQLTMNDGSMGYTRDGSFKLDKDGYIRTNTGSNLMGYPTDKDGNATSVSIQKLQLPTSAPIAASATTTIEAEFNLDARALGPADTLAAGDPPVLRSTYGTSLNVYDAQGVATDVTFYFVKTDTDNEWEVYDSLGSTTPVATLTFDDSGDLTTPTDTITTGPNTGKFGVTLATPTAFSSNNPNDTDGFLDGPLDIVFEGATQYGTSFAVSNLTQDGYTAGELVGLNIGEDGVITARYSNGEAQTAGQIALADFRNIQGLSPLGGNAWASTSESGLPVQGQPGDGKFGILRAGALEESNVDLTAELVNMMTAQRAYQANAQTIKTQDQIMSTLVNLR
ncbi:MAG: flagellar hook protein FlgE [Rhodoferax sp.]|jgi:flagellar hook protein FlgE|uniref:flagellar hook protein FlgE n=1 Tax=Rhodoferax sp. TaxID=50421 RepID=UPI001B6601E6|nr:flagellar hook protein FlgE [Rhodoferax sp.]MBP9147959.1 flagellar hook protein FlgE [Rhodoferax sp.]MBP9736731.1 flagellar hook protein FlgE [Rhodoferax sp.]